MRKNCSSDLLKFKAEGREFAKFLRSLEQFIQTVKGQNAFLTCSWRFLILSNKLEQLEFKLEKNNKLLGFRNMQEKLENIFLIFIKGQLISE